MKERRRRGRPSVELPGADLLLLQPVSKPRLSEEARRQLLERIADGRLPASTPLSELELARRLGVSRTPLHEAMVALSRDGLVESLGRRGWRVLPLSEGDAAEVYPVLANLLALALRLAGTSVLGLIDDLRRLAAIERLPEPDQRLAAYREWHEIVLAECPNRVLREAIRPLWVRAVRYERSAVEAGHRLPSELAGVVDCLRRADIDGASRLLERHWRDRGGGVVLWTRLGSEAAPNDGGSVPGVA